MRGIEAETFSGAVIEVMHRKGGLMKSDGIKAKILREGLSDEATNVLVGAALPGGVGMGEIEVGIENEGVPFMICELLADIGRQRMNADGLRRRPPRRVHRTIFRRPSLHPTPTIAVTIIGDLFSVSSE